MLEPSLLALALGAGMLAAVNPCGFALLPAYLSLLVVGDQPTTRPRAVGRALGLTAAMTLGFALVFGVFGLAVAPFAAGVQRYLPYVTVVLGLSLAVVGALLLAGRAVALPRLRLPGRAGRGAGSPRPLTRGLVPMAGFGAGYALASLTCTVAPFLAVVVAGFRTDSVTTGVVLFLAYAAGMGVVVGAVAVAVALASDGLVRSLRSTGRWLPRVSGAILLLAGSYVAWYGVWEVRVLRGSVPADPVVDAAAAVQRTLAEAVATVGPGGWALVVLALVTAGVAGRRWRGVAR